MNEKSELEVLKEEVQSLREALASVQDGDKNDSFKLDLDNDEIIKDFQEEFTKIKDKTDQVSLELKEQIKQKPLQSISIAFGLGLILSKILGGRR